MKLKLPWIVVAALGLIAGTNARAQRAELIQFELEDQFGNVHRRSDVQGRIVLLIGSDKGGSSFNGVWSNAIRNAVKDHPRYDQIAELPYSDLRGVPFFLKRFIRGKFPESPDHWVLMDWKGILAKAYNFVPKASNTLVFAPDASLVHHVAGRELDQQKLERIIEALRTLLDQTDVPQG